jgi:hypothetical protein
LVSPVAGAVGCCGFFSGVAPEEEPLEEPEPIEPEPVVEPAPAAEELSLFGASLDVLAEPELDWPSVFGALEDDAPAAAEPSFFSVLAEEEPLAAEPSDFFWGFAAELPPAAELLMPRAARVGWSIWPEALRPFEVWNSFRPFWVFGPTIPSTWPTS